MGASTNKISESGYTVLPYNSEKVDQQDIKQQEDTSVKKKIVEAFRSVYQTIKSWFGGSASPVLEEKIKSVVSKEADASKPVADLADLIQEIAQQNPSKLAETQMEFNEGTGEFVVIFGDSEPISFIPDLEEQNKALESLYTVSKDHLTIDSLSDSYRTSMLKDYRRLGVGVRVFNKSGVYDVEGDVTNLLKEAEKLTESCAQDSCLDEGAEKIRDKLLGIYGEHISEVCPARVALEGISSQAGLAEFLKICMSDVAVAVAKEQNDSGDIPSYAPSAIGHTTNIYEVGQQTFYLDLSISINNMNPESGEVIQSDHRFQAIISPSGFHLVGKQQNLSGFPEYRRPE